MPSIQKQPIAKKDSKISLKRRGLKSYLKCYLWPSSIWKRIGVMLLAIVVLFTGCMYGVGQWYIYKHRNEPLTIGTTFIADYATIYGLNPHDTMKAIVGDLGIKQIRLVSYWSNIEPTQGHYNFSELDWEFNTANQYGAKVSLAIGLRQPRWPECHVPTWAANQSVPQLQPSLNKYMAAVIDRYKDNPALENYQLENEFFMTVFGECTNFDRGRLVSEYNLTKSHDRKHPIIISRSNNWVGLPLGQPRPDEFGISVYKRVWDSTFTHRYFEYPLPSWFYAALAGGGEILTGKDMMIHELQAEPWPPRGEDVVNTSLNEQFKSMNAKRMKSRISYAESTGMRTIDLWGAEWWYWLMVKKHDPSVWNTVKIAIQQADEHNQQLPSTTK